MKCRNTYITFVNRNCAGSASPVKNLFYWGNSPFTATITYLVSFCFIALLPGLYRVFATSQFIPAIVDVLSVTGMAVMVFMPRINLEVRKIVFICCVYSLSSALLYYLGLHGALLVYLLGASIFTIFIFKNVHAFRLAWINVFICFCIAMARFLYVVDNPQQRNHLLAGAWMAVCSNLVLLSFCFSLAALIYALFNVLQETIQKEKKLKKELKKYQESLQPIVYRLKLKNNKLEQFTNSDSHDLKKAG